MTEHKPMRFRLIDKEGKAYAPFRLKLGFSLRDVTRQAFPGQSQDEGWDVERVRP